MTQERLAAQALSLGMEAAANAALGMPRNTRSLFDQTDQIRDRQGRARRNLPVGLPPG
jgi:hypothetical protein